MTNIFLVFLGAAYLNNLVLLRFFDRPATGSSTPHQKLLYWAGFLIAVDWLLHAGSDDFQLPVIVGNYVHALTFVLAAMTVGVGPFASAIGQVVFPERLRLSRRLLPLLIANLCVFVFVALQQPSIEGFGYAALFCAVASAAFFSIGLLFTAMRERIEHADVVPGWRGAPLVATTASIIALAMMGFAGALPW